jgi:uncharacterized protein
MILTNEFVVEAPVDRAWSLLDKIESVISCMPGAAYIGRDGDGHKASIKMKVGAISANFQGTVRFLEKDGAAHTARIRGVGKDLGGKASATATISVKLEPLPSARTKVLIETDMALTGRLAQFGGGVIADISSRMIKEFTHNLHEAVIARSTESARGIEAPGEVIAEKEAAIAKKEPAAFDLGPAMGAVAKRWLKYAAMLVGFLFLVWLIVKFS